MYILEKVAYIDMRFYTFYFLGMSEWDTIYTDWGRTGLSYRCIFCNPERTCQKGIIVESNGSWDAKHLEATSFATPGKNEISNREQKFIWFLPWMENNKL